MEKMKQEGNKSKAIFLDRDGTINIEKGYIYRIEDFEFLPGVIQALKLLQLAGYQLIIITNQSGIARGYYKETDFQKLNKWMLSELKKNNIDIDAVYYCPHHPEARLEKYKKNCSCRKPQIGMYNLAVEEFNIDLNYSYAIGDQIRDCEICKFTNCRGYLLAHNEQEEVINKVKRGEYLNIKYAENLLEAVYEIILNTQVSLPL